MTSTSKRSESYLVVGGSGFLGSYIVKALLARGETSVSVFDIVSRSFDGDVKLYVGDIASKEDVSNAIRKSGATSIFHTASPVHDQDDYIHQKVNVQGTRVLLDAAIANKVTKFVYTSSTGVTYTADPLEGADETLPIPTKGFDAYHSTKAKAEIMVLAANNLEGLRTVAIRPCGMIGPEDRQAIFRFSRSWKNRHVQMGDNKTLVDYVYVGNVADAHLLAADKMDSPAVAGQAFIITNGDPWFFWDFARYVWNELDNTPPAKTMVIPRGLAMFFAILSEIWGWIMGKKPIFNRFSVIFATTHQWYNIDKARKLLGYEPSVSLTEGVDLMVKVCRSVPHLNLSF
ncbi:hypothetical protein JAAARDRAFT_126566 [Jaapia argillacea MUCL 33604]|uniref:3-beta hydroxysteroid dehydrogenase/isomerase domain-containing protein n=1 Tax=Jaapia argillacea MUCL 33604 TaxID=933084 RepID=A0A067PY83_9AGAM|nr:hypothetical protein JAAARDRAFT_126566 [Jaapia argillacea MUCL 33604]